MRMIAVDDEKPALQGLMATIRQVDPEAQVTGFRDAKAAIDYVAENRVDVAFLDIEMRDMNGLQAAEKLIEMNPDINIIFTTGYSEYTGDAFNLHASGYITKPISAEKLAKELSDLRRPVPSKEESLKLRVQTFGNFEIFYDGKPLSFQYSKTRELVAYLVDRRGAFVSNGELVAVLWDDDRPGAHNSYFKNIRADLKNTLTDYDLLDIVVRQRGKIAIVKDRIDCDYYHFLEGDEKAITAYQGEYMAQYSWAEMTNAAISEQLLNETFKS